MVESHFKIFLPVWKFCSNLKECSTYRNLMCSLTAKQALCTSCVKKTSHLKIWWLNIFQQTAYQSYHNFDVFVRTDTRLSQWNCISLISVVPYACATNIEILWLWIELVIIIVSFPEEETNEHTHQLFRWNNLACDWGQWATRVQQNCLSWKLMKKRN